MTGPGRGSRSATSPVPSWPRLAPQSASRTAPITSETFHAWRPSRRLSRPRTGPALGWRDCDVHRADESGWRRSSPMCRRRCRLLLAFHIASPALRTRLPPDAVGRARGRLRRTDTRTRQSHACRLAASRRTLRTLSRAEGDSCSEAIGRRATLAARRCSRTDAQDPRRAFLIASSIAASLCVSSQRTTG